MVIRYGEISGFVLAGGASRRMGHPKAALVLGNETMLERQVRILRRVCRHVAMIGVPPAPLTTLSGMEVPFIPDHLPGRGPLGGILTGLTESRTEWSLFLGCDMPFISAVLLRFLCREALSSGAEVTIPESRDGRYQPLCAVYRRTALYAIRSRLTRGENKVTGFLGSVRCRVIGWPQIVRARLSARVFDNMNTPQDYEAARKRLD